MRRRGFLAAIAAVAVAPWRAVCGAVAPVAPEPVDVTILAGETYWLEHGVEYGTIDVRGSMGLRVGDQPSSIRELVVHDDSMVAIKTDTTTFTCDAWEVFPEEAYAAMGRSLDSRTA